MPARLFSDMERVWLALTYPLRRAELSCVVVSERPPGTVRSDGAGCGGAADELGEGSHRFFMAFAGLSSAFPGLAVGRLGVEPAVVGYPAHYADAPTDGGDLPRAGDERDEDMGDGDPERLAASNSVMAGTL